MHLDYSRLIPSFRIIGWLRPYQNFTKETSGWENRGHWNSALLTFFCSGFSALLHFLTSSCFKASQVEKLASSGWLYNPSQHDAVMSCHGAGQIWLHASDARQGSRQWSEKQKCHATWKTEATSLSSLMDCKLLLQVLYFFGIQGCGDCDLVKRPYSTGNELFKWQ